jgi:hypothetical protein
MDNGAMTPEDRWDDDLDALLDRKDHAELKNAVGVACEARDDLRRKAADFARLAAEGKQAGQSTTRKTELQARSTAYKAAAALLDDGLREALRDRPRAEAPAALTDTPPEQAT